MNLLEQNRHTEENDNREKEQNGFQELLQKPYMIPILLGIIVVLLICIMVMLVLMRDQRKAVQSDIDSDLQQTITDYANERKENDYTSGLTGETVSINPVDEKEKDDVDSDDGRLSQSDDEITPVAEDSGKIPVVVGAEDETDVSYSKEYILNEAFPYFVANNHEAIWDLAHLKRYVKLSSELKDTNQYYYKGDVNSDGKPNGKGLAIYEDNSYYYGDWVDGVRTGGGTWFRFYINEKSTRNAMGIYTAHLYSGEWADDLPDGQGAEHYEVDTSKISGGERVIQNIVGGFSKGLYDGELFADTSNNIGIIEEWYGVASNGVFDLWRDMSSIGECSVWRNKKDPDLCMDIDKSENKNQGIRELLKENSLSKKKE